MQKVKQKYLTQKKKFNKRKQKKNHTRKNKTGGVGERNFINRQLREHLKKRILSTNKEKWLTIYDAYRKIDDLRVKYDNNNEYLLILEDLNKYIENLEKKFNS